ncbi:MAG: hypothetical protein FK734_13120 [Asgard group archaeon]|nr:hypothetical protein [Asgard group archaeon]
MKTKIIATIIAYLSLFAIIFFLASSKFTNEINYSHTWITNVSEKNIVIDGDISDWGDTFFTQVENANISIGYDESNVYVAIRWLDITSNDSFCHWNKTGMYNSTHANWSLINGNDDVLWIEFTNRSNFHDVWIWTASNRINQNYAYEINSFGEPDSGDLPFYLNSNGNDTELGQDVSLNFPNLRPIYDNTSTAITDETIIPNGTIYKAWFPQTASGSQNDVLTASNWDGTFYTVEFSRALNTGNDDDLIINQTNLLGWTFSFGIADGDNARDMIIPSDEIINEHEYWNLDFNFEISFVSINNVFVSGNTNGTSISNTISSTDETTLWYVNWFFDSYKTTSVAIIIIFVPVLILSSIFIVASESIRTLLAGSIIGITGCVGLIIGSTLFSYNGNIIMNSVNKTLVKNDIRHLITINTTLKFGIIGPIVIGIAILLLLSAILLITYLPKKILKK